MGIFKSGRAGAAKAVLTPADLTVMRQTLPSQQPINKPLLYSMQLRAAAATTACVSFVAYAAYTGLSTLWHNPQWCPVVLGAAAAAEALFAVAWLRKFHKLNTVHVQHHKPKHPSFNPRHAFDRFVQSPLGQHKTSKWICIREMLQTWFGDVPIEDIHKGNVCDLVTYGFWYMTREEYQEATGEPPELLVEELERAWGIQFTPGHNPHLSFMAHLWQPIRCAWRPLVFYLGTEGVCLLCRAMLLAMGFQSGRVRGSTYYTYGTEAPHPMRVPILFQHGVGVGLLPYIMYLARLACLGHPLAAVECAHLGMRWTEVLDADQVVEGLVELLQHRLGWDKACVSGHSYGTFYASRLLQLHPHLVHSVCLIDPVTFNMFTGKLIKNFVYTNNDLTTWFVARDLHHAASVCRNFFWSCLCLWPDQLPDKTMVVLSEADNLVPVRETFDMLRHEAPHALVMHHPNHKHAGFLVDSKWQDAVVSTLASLLDTAAADWSQQQEPLPPISAKNSGNTVAMTADARSEQQRLSAARLFERDRDITPQVVSDSSMHDDTSSPSPPLRQRVQRSQSRSRSRSRSQRAGSGGMADHDAPGVALPDSNPYLTRLRPKPHRMASPGE